MHNKAAETDESLHLFDEFADSDTTKLRCQRCTNLIELRVKVGSSYINWSGARKHPLARSPWFVLTLTI